MFEMDSIDFHGKKVFMSRKVDLATKKPNDNSEDECPNYRLIVVAHTCISAVFRLRSCSMARYHHRLSVKTKMKNIRHESTLTR